VLAFVQLHIHGSGAGPGVTPFCCVFFFAVQCWKI